MSKQLILASSSAYKKSLLERLCIPFSCDSPNIDETPQPNESPINLVKRLSEQKALTIATQNPGKVVIGADQAGDIDGNILEKPENYENAFKQLQYQSGKTVYFHCGITLLTYLSSDNILKTTQTSTTEVVFRQLTDSEIKTYLEKERPYDCAGSFKSEGLGISLFHQINSSDPTCLIGLPLILVREMLGNTGINNINLIN